jgi:flagellar assembly protein FliH
MNLSSSAEYENVFAPVTMLEYCDMAEFPLSDGAGNLLSGVSGSNGSGKRKAEVELSEADFQERIRRERTDATQQTEQRLRQEYEAKLQAARAPIAAALAGFEVQRTEYYARVEHEVVQLALSIAAKILHREAQVDPTLVAALVKMTIEKMSEGSNVTVRVAPGNAKTWREYFAGHSTVTNVQITEDPSLSKYDCLVETDLGSTNFGLNTQLKEIEKGFFDLMALRPDR